MNASSSTATPRRTPSNGSSGPQLNVDRIRRLAEEYEHDQDIPEFTTEQARAVLAILQKTPAGRRAVAAISNAEVQAHVAHLLGACGQSEWSCSFCEAEQAQG